MKKEIKSGLEGTTAWIKKMIEEGEDFLVREYNVNYLSGFMYPKDDIDPHVCDFQKVGASIDDVAFYFAYVTTLPGYDVIRVSNMKVLDTHEKRKNVDNERFDKFEDDYMTDAMRAKKERTEKEIAENKTEETL